MDETRKTLMIFTAFQELESKGFELKDGVLSSSRFTIDVNENKWDELYYQLHVDDGGILVGYTINAIIEHLDSIEESEKNHLAVLQKRIEFWNEISGYQIEMRGMDQNVLINEEGRMVTEFDTLSDKEVFRLILKSEIEHAKFMAKEEIRQMFRGARDILGL